MRRALLVALVVMLSAPACWPQRGFDAGRSSWNPYETRLDSRSVRRLTLLWDTHVVRSEPPVEGGGISGLMAVGDDIVVTGDDGVVARLDGDGGTETWRSVLDPLQTSVPPAMDLPTLFRRWVFVGWVCCRAGFGGWLWLDLSDGQVSGGPSQPISQGAIADVAVADGTVASLGVFEFSRVLTWGSRVVHVNGLDGRTAGSRFAVVGRRVMWTHGSDAVSFGPECRPSSDPALTCEPDWRTTLGTDWATPAAVGRDAVVYTDPSGTVTVLDAATGAVRWRAELGASLTEPVVTRRTIVVATQDGRVAAFRSGGCDAPICQPVWEAPARGAPIAGLAGGGDVVYAATSSGQVVAFAIDGCGTSTCPPLATVDAGGPFPVGPIVHNGRLVVGTAHGHVVAFAPAPP